MGMKNLIALAVHPLMALATSIFFVFISSINVQSGEMQAITLVTSVLLWVAVLQAFTQREMLDLNASPTNYGQTVALIGLAVGLAAFADSGGTAFLGPEANFYLAGGMLIIALTEGITRLMSMINIWNLGSEKYAEQRIQRILKGSMCNWDSRIDGLLKLTKGRSIMHDEHAVHLAQAVQKQLGRSGTAI